MRKVVTETALPYKQQYISVHHDSVLHFFHVLPSEYIPELLEIYFSGYAQLRNYFWKRWRDARRYLKWLRKKCRPGFIVLHFKGAPKGWIAYDVNFVNERGESVGAIHEMVVHKGVQHYGFGSLLFRKACEVLEQHCGRIELWVGTQNRHAIEFYRTHGFQCSGPIDGKWLKMSRYTRSSLHFSLVS